MKEVEEYLKINHTHYFCNYSLWHHSENRDIWHFWKKNIGIFKPSVRERMKPKSKRTKIEVCTYSDWVWDKSDAEKISFKFVIVGKKAWKYQMKKIIYVTLLLLTNLLHAQTVSYTENTSIIANPERGLQKYSCTSF
jgi:hypothetical protein